MLRFKDDPLLVGTSWLVTLLMWLFYLPMAAVAVVVVGMVAFQGDVTQEIAAGFVDPDMRGSVLIVELVLVGAILALFLMVQFLRKLKAIIGSVGEGDPFVRANADRLRVMGIIMISIQGLYIGLGTLAIFWLDRLGEPKPGTAINFSEQNIDFPLTAILVGLLLIILARVFERGADMREDLEGTV